MTITLEDLTVASYGQPYQRRPFSDYVLFFALAIIVAVAAHFVLPPRSGAIIPTSAIPSVYDRVMRAGTIRCAYITYPPSCIKDPNTGKLSGIFVEIMERVGKDLDLKIEWAEEVGWTTMVEAIRADRVDLFGSGVWANSTRGRLVDFTIPVYYNGIGVYVRAGDDRFTRDLNAINSPGVKIATIDGEISDILARQQFPKATRVSLPQLSDNSQMMLNVVQGRADVTFAEAQAGTLFLHSNAKSLVNIAAHRPIRIFPAVLMFKQDQMAFKSMLDTALQELINSGFVDDLLRKYSDEPGAVYPTAYPYRAWTKQNPALDGDKK